eukprot:1143719-Pelagomonas_calceolata.AAC.5
MEGDHGEGEVVPKGPACSVRYVAARQAALPGGKGLTKTRTHILITKMCQWSSWAHRLKSAGPLVDFSRKQQYLRIFPSPPICPSLFNSRSLELNLQGSPSFTVGEVLDWVHKEEGNALPDVPAGTQFFAYPSDSVNRLQREQPIPVDFHLRLVAKGLEKVARLYEEKADQVLATPSPAFIRQEVRTDPAHPCITGHRRLPLDMSAERSMGLSYT